MLASWGRTAHRAAVTLAAKQKQMIEDLAVIDDSQERLAVVVDRARNRPPLPDSERTEAHRVKGCVSLAWVVGEMRDGRCFFRCDADSPLVRGLIALLCDFYSDATPADVFATEPELFEQLSLSHSLSPTRLNGLGSVRAAIRAYAGNHLPATGRR